MRESIGGTWITGLVIGFMLIFVAFLSIAINYTKAFQMKNDVLTIIEEKEGLTSGSNGSIALINNFLQKNNYNAKRSCPVMDGSYGATNLDTNTLEPVTNKNKTYYYCIEKLDSSSIESERKITYNVKIFLSFTLPILGDFSAFEITGQTIQIPFSRDDLNARKI